MKKIPGTDGRADRSRLGAQPSRDDGDLRSVGGPHHRLVHEFLDIGDEVTVDSGEPTAEHDDLRIEQGDEAGESFGYPPGEPVEHQLCLVITLGDGRRHVFAPDVSRITPRQREKACALPFGNDFPCDVGQTGPGSHRLPTTNFAAGTDMAVGIDEHVPGFAGEAVGTAMQPSADDDAPGDTGPLVHDHSVHRPPCRSQPMLGEGCTRGIVLSDHRQTELSAEFARHV